MTALPSNSRIDYLDAVRAFALLLGIVFHASLSFMPSFIGWAVMDINTSSLVPIFLLISHSFRMELFFLIAGFFSHMTFYKKGTSAFLKSRATRIVLPFVVAWFILRPLLVSGWVMGTESMRGEVDIWNGLSQGFQTLKALPAGIFTGSHLWFLYYLVLVTVTTLVVKKLLALAPSAQNWLGATVDRIIQWVANTSSSAAILAIPTAFCLWRMSQWGMDTPDKSLIPHLPTFLVYLGCFSFGWLLHRQPELLTNLSQLTPTRIINLFASIGFTIYLSGFQANPSFEYIAEARAAFCFSYGVMMWSLVFVSIGLFRVVIRKQNAIVRYVADASYWLYLIHLPIVVWLQIAFAELQLNWFMKLAAISGITIAFSLLTYDLFVRSTFIGKTLNGARKRRAIFARGGSETSSSKKTQELHTA
ncbi:acyltransferase family protein [Pelagicoccus sp. SDUM812003]|uniref:acyltransferase family protein n=1 Tax=Pelagicoccus sp. SDUM812003 TaxID=3041267 RepID=UPI00280E1DB3|nr:acyltransferase family protein [Pelagicoccus sp. SDUM812003]MDQ8204045.1 acyltransferase family protein [Pelagicoccus sp. SDUM812003]